MKRVVDDVRERIGYWVGERVSEGSARDRLAMAIRGAVTEHMGGAMGFRGDAYQIAEAIRWRVMGALRERVRDAVRERVGEVVRERLGQALREKLGDVLRQTLSEQMGTHGGYKFDPDHFAEVLGARFARFRCASAWGRRSRARSRDPARAHGAGAARAARRRNAHGVLGASGGGMRPGCKATRASASRRCSSRSSVTRIRDRLGEAIHQRIGDGSERAAR